MPTHVGPYGAARYPGSLWGSVPGHDGHQIYTSATRIATFYENLTLPQAPLDLPVWPRRMPVEEELGTISPPTAGIAALGVADGNAGPPSPVHSDSDASNSSIELGSVRRGENAQAMCRWKNCGRWFTSLQKLATHVGRVHAAPGHKGLFYCGWEGCGRGDRGFNARYKMLVHVRTHTNEKPHHCFQCEKSFSRAENLKIHARSHTGERPYVCPVEGCNKAYSNSSDRFKHTRTHAVDKPYCCKVPGCPKRYTDPSSLRKHVKTYRHYVNNNNDKLQEKMFDEGTSPEKQSSTTHSESDKKDSSIDSSASGTSPKTSLSFEEQRKFVEWNNMYNLQERAEHEQVTPPKNTYGTEVLRPYPRITDESYFLSNSVHPVTPLYANYRSTSPQHIPDNLAMRMNMQSTPIKCDVESMDTGVCKTSSVDYRNIESIVNSSTPCRKPDTPVVPDVIRHSVIKRVEVSRMDVVEQHRPMREERPRTEAPSDCCCRHKCCVHGSDSSLERTKILSDLLLKAQNPLFRQLLSTMDLQCGLHNMWSNVADGGNTCGQDLRVRNSESVATEMEQELPLDLTIAK